MQELLHHYRFIPVVALLGAAAALATVRGRLPLALRGLRKVMRRDAGVPREQEPPPPAVPAWRRVLAFLLVLLAFAFAVAA